MGLLGHVSSAVSKTGGRFSNQEQPPEGAHADDTEELDEEHGNVLLSLIGQLRIGMDLSKVTLPTFVLEPRSMLERVTDFLSHPDLLFGADRLESPEERFLAILTYYMSGWHIKPKGVKKPYNPILGEFFRCSYTYANGTHGVYIAEQVSHHPPISAYYYVSPENNVLIYGDLRPKSKFLGNSAATIMGGESHVVLLNKLGDGEYTISMPNMYARGILFGKMVLELGDHSDVSNVANDISCHVEFKVKGYFGGSYNAIGAKVLHNGRTKGELTGKWNDVMEYKDAQTGQSRVIFDAKTAATAQKSVPPLEQQEPNESQRYVGMFLTNSLWAKVTEGIKTKNMDMATEYKSAVEEEQRQATRAREASGQVWKPRFFLQHNDRFIPILKYVNGKANISALPDVYRPPAAVQYFATKVA